MEKERKLLLLLLLLLDASVLVQENRCGSGTQLNDAIAVDAVVKPGVDLDGPGEVEHVDVPILLDFYPVDNS